MTKAKLIEMVNGHLRKVGHGITFDVVKDGVRQQDSWWHVPVLATRNGKDVPREVTVNIFANIEDELEHDERVSVLFIPVVSDTKTVRARNGN